MSEGKKMTSNRKLQLKSLMLQVGKMRLEAEAERMAKEKEAYLEQNCPSVSMTGTMEELQLLCKKIHLSIDQVDEERYDMETKISKTNKEIDDLKIKVVDLKGKFKKPVLRKVRMSAEQMLQALLGSKHTVNLDLRANLKQVKKEVKVEPADAVGDWRKTIEDKSGMGGRKKMFEGVEVH